MPSCCHGNCGIVPHRFSIQLFVDFDLTRHWLDEELVLAIATDDGVQDVTVHLAVDVFGSHLSNQIYMLS